MYIIISTYNQFVVQILASLKKKKSGFNIFPHSKVTLVTISLLRQKIINNFMATLMFSILHIQNI